MSDDWRDEDGLPEARPQRARRQGPGRGQVIRRRLVAIGSIVIVAVAVIIVITSAGAGEDVGKASTHASHDRRSAKKTNAKKSAAHGQTGKVRNATPQADWEPHTGPVPILEYHVLGAPPEDAPYPELYVGRTDFEKQMDWLEEQGYQAVTLEQVQEAWYHGDKLPPKPIVLSFDDGYRPQFTFALPTLRKHGWAGVLDLKAEGSDLYESNVKAMIAAGWELAAHTIHLQREYHVPVDNFCYPAGQFDETVIEAVKAAGYTGATTEISGFAEKDKPYELARLEILRESHLAGLAEDLRNGRGATAELGA